MNRLTWMIELSSPTSGGVLHVLRALLGFAERFGLAEVDFDYFALKSDVKATALLGKVFDIDED